MKTLRRLDFNIHYRGVSFNEPTLPNNLSIEDNKEITKQTEIIDSILSNSLTTEEAKQKRSEIISILFGTYFQECKGVRSMCRKILSLTHKDIASISLTVGVDYIKIYQQNIFVTEKNKNYITEYIVYKIKIFLSTNVHELKKKIKLESLNHSDINDSMTYTNLKETIKNGINNIFNQRLITEWNSVSIYSIIVNKNTEDNFSSEHRQVYSFDVNIVQSIDTQITNIENNINIIKICKTYQEWSLAVTDMMKMYEKHCENHIYFHRDSIEVLSRLVHVKNNEFKSKYTDKINEELKILIKVNDTYDAVIRSLWRENNKVEYENTFVVLENTNVYVLKDEYKQVDIPLNNVALLHYKMIQKFNEYKELCISTIMNNMPNNPIIEDYIFSNKNMLMLNDPHIQLNEDEINMLTHVQDLIAKSCNTSKKAFTEARKILNNKLKEDDVKRYFLKYKKNKNKNYYTNIETLYSTQDLNLDTITNTSSRCIIM